MTPHKRGETHPSWRGGRYVHKGYMMIKAWNHPLSDKQGYVPEHRLVMANLYGVESVVGKVVHHIDGNKLNSSPENLEIMDNKEHPSMHNRKPNSNRRKIGESNPLIKCACGCDELRDKYDKYGLPRVFINGHHNKLRLK